jgi:hypothetical protein
MKVMIVVWIVWAALGLTLLTLIMYRASLTRYEEDQLFLDDASERQHKEQDDLLKKVKRIEPVIRIFGGAEGVVTLGIVAFYLMDALRQF